MSLTERYRPRQLEELVGQSKVVRQIKFMQERGGLRGRVFWMVGSSGSGKTSAARIIAKEIADPWAVIEIDAQELTMDTVREFERMCQCKPIGQKGCHVFICNGAHRLSDRVVSRLQTKYGVIPDLRPTQKQRFKISRYRSLRAEHPECVSIS